LQRRFHERRRCCFAAVTNRRDRKKTDALDKPEDGWYQQNSRSNCGFTIRPDMQVGPLKTYEHKDACSGLADPLLEMRIRRTVEQAWHSHWRRRQEIHHRTLSSMPAGSISCH
jgi:hypothetical protein